MQVLAATYRRTGQVYALKIIDKNHLTRFNKVKYAYVEKDSLARLSTAGHPGVVRLHWAFSDISSLCEFQHSAHYTINSRWEYHEVMGVAIPQACACTVRRKGSLQTHHLITIIIGVH